jgi:peptidoglycan/LPS O-acetylase OafA/YrhL
MTEFLSGVVTCGYLVAGALFFKLWRRTGDGLFRALTIAFLLFALNQVLAAGVITPTDPSSLIYSLRILGFVILLGALLDRKPRSRN